MVLKLTTLVITFPSSLFHDIHKMLRIVPMDVESGDEWGSDAEADARDIGRFRRVAGADRETISYALEFYPPRNAKIRDKIYTGLGLGVPPAAESSNKTSKPGVISSSPRGGRGRGVSGPDGNGGGRRGGRGGRGRGAAGSTGSVTGDDVSRGAEDEKVRPGYDAKVGIQQPVRSKGKQEQQQQSGSSVAPSPLVLPKSSGSGVQKPEGDHPGYIVTLYGKKASSCGVVWCSELWCSAVWCESSPLCVEVKTVCARFCPL